MAEGSVTNTTIFDDGRIERLKEFLKLVTAGLMRVLFRLVPKSILKIKSFGLKTSLLMPLLKVRNKCVCGSTVCYL